MESYYNFANFVEVGKEQLYDNKIGSLDLETMIDSNSNKFLSVFPLNKGENVSLSDITGLGEHKIVYAGGWKTDNLEFYIYGDEYKYGDIIIKTLVDKIFENKLFGYTFFVHNLGKFDGLYLINSIGSQIDNKYYVKGQ